MKMKNARAETIARYLFWSFVESPLRRIRTESNFSKEFSHSESTPLSKGLNPQKLREIRDYFRWFILKRKGDYFADGIISRLFTILPAEVGQTWKYFRSSINIDAEERKKGRRSSCLAEILQQYKAAWIILLFKRPTWKLANIKNCTADQGKEMFTETNSNGMRSNGIDDSVRIRRKKQNELFRMLQDEEMTP